MYIGKEMSVRDISPIKRNANPFNVKPFEKPSQNCSSQSIRSISQQKEALDPQQIQCVVANDNHFQLMAVSYALKAANLNIQCEGVNGLEVLQYIQMNSHIKLDVVLLDLDMPIMDGFEACRQIIDFYKNLSKYRLEKPNKMEDQFKEPN